MTCFEWTEIRNGKLHHIAADRFEWIDMRRGQAYLITANNRPSGWKVCKEEKVDRECFPAVRFYLSEIRVDQFYLVIADRTEIGWDAAERDTWEVGYFTMTLTKDYQHRLDQMADAVVTALSAKRAAHAA